MPGGYVKCGDGTGGDSDRILDGGLNSSAVLNEEKEGNRGHI